MPLATTFTSVILALVSGTVVRNPSVHDIQSASSIHVLAFTAQGALLVAESEGSFSMDDWNDVYEQGKKLCCGEPAAGPDEMQDVGEEKDGGMKAFVKAALEEKVESDLHWRD